jgi:catechol-2,3-dioxygenase
MKIEKIHHVAYRCRDAKETVEWCGSMQPEMGRDLNTPSWVQHIAFRVKERAPLLEFKDHLVARGVDVLGGTDHGMFHSIYFFDPNGHKVELACPDPAEEAMIARVDAVKWQMMEEWSHTKRAPKHAAFLHANVGGGNGDTT